MNNKEIRQGLSNAEPLLTVWTMANHRTELSEPGQWCCVCQIFVHWIIIKVIQAT